MNIEQRKKRYELKKIPIKEIKAVKNSSEWEMDDKGFFLIDPRPEEELIYAHHYHSNKEYNLTITGKTAEDIYYTILRENLINSMMHAAYLGSELQKAEILVRYKIDWYIQDNPFDIPNEILCEKIKTSKDEQKENSKDNHEKDPEACEVIFENPESQ
jgi:hypothetical protein